MNKQRSAVLLIALALSALLFLAGYAMTQAKGDAADKEEEMSAILEPDMMFGIDIEDISDDRIDAELDAAASTGAAWIRIYAFWRFIEPQPPDERYRDGQWGSFSGKHAYTWDHVDRIVDGARRRGLNVYLTNMW